jgi:hypothetical protein
MMKLDRVDVELLLLAGLLAAAKVAAIGFAFVWAIASLAPGGY